MLGELSLSSSVYYRYTTDVVERVSFVEDNVNVTKPVNLGTTGATGLELNAKYRPTKWLTLSSDANYNTFDREAELEGQNFDFKADQLSGRLVSKWELPLDIDLEVTGSFRTGVQTVQGRDEGFTWMDVGLRKKLLKGRVVVSAAVRDAFASRIFVSRVQQPDFDLYRERFRGRFWTLGLSYGFGKGEAMEFAGRRRW